MRKVLLVVAFLFCIPAFAQTYNYPVGLSCGPASPPEYCGVALNADGDGSTATVNFYWAGSPLVGQSVPLSWVWLSQYEGFPVYSVQTEAAMWQAVSPGPDSCAGQVANNGDAKYPFVLDATCQMQFQDGTMHTVTAHKLLGKVYKIGGRATGWKWVVGGGTIVVQ